MDSYDAATYGDEIAEIYDQLYSNQLGDPDTIVNFLTRFAENGKVLELGVGTGRLALPLAERGLDVWGIDSSARIVEQLRAKKGGLDVNVRIGDLADVGVPGAFQLIFVSFNTFFLLTNQADQARCLHNVADHLDPGGAFVVEAMIPDDRMYDRGQRIHVHDVQSDAVWFEAARYDPSRQQLRSVNIIMRPDGTRFYPAILRFVTPAELDLLAKAAGLILESRWDDWDERPFAPNSTGHISVYRKPI